MPWFQNASWPRVTHAEIVNRARILVIDDADFPYLKLFRRDGYTVERWNRVKELKSLEEGKYDLILLDLHGVGTGESEDHGFGLLKHLREARPAQIVVAYSNAEWSLEYQPFFRDADAVLSKRADYVEFKRAVDELLDRKFSLGFYVDRVLDVLADYDLDPRLRRRIEKAILKRRPEPLRAYLGSRVDNVASVDRVLAIVDVAISTADLWTG